MLTCNCNLGGTSPCRSCPRFIEVYGYSPNIPYTTNTWTKPDRQDEIIELLKKIEEKLGTKND